MPAETLSRTADPCPWSNCLDLCTCIRSEYQEMPGLALTLPQAARLWNVDRASCSRALDGLIASGFLVRRRGLFVLADAGRRTA